MKNNNQILEDRINEYNKIEGPRVGDFLKLPYGLYTRFTYKWEDHIQTGGSGSTAYYLGNGYLSYSGSLDSGVKLDQIKPTEETKEGAIWFFDNDIQGAGRGKYFTMSFRVFEPIEGADLKGCPEIAAHEKREFLKTVDTVTRINGNGQPYTLPIPEIFINEEINDVALKHIEENTGMKFTKYCFGYKAQPVKQHQIVSLLLTYNFKSTYYNNCSFENTLMLQFNRDRN